MVHPIIGKYPFLTPTLLSTGFGVVREQKKAKSGAVQPIPEAIHFRYGVDFTPIYDMEFAFSFNLDDIDNLLQALRYVVELAGKKAQGAIMKHSVYYDMYNSYTLRSISLPT